MSSWDPDLLADALLRTIDFLTPYVVGRRSTPIFGMEVTPTRAFDPYPGFLWKGHDLESHISKSSAFLRDFLFTAAVGAVLLSLTIRGRRWLGGLGLGLLGAAVSYSALLSVVTIYIPRYGSFVDQLALVALVGTLAARPTSRRAAASPS